MFKESLDQRTIPFSDEKKPLSSLSRYLPLSFRQGQQSSISRNANVRLAAAMWALALEEIGPMFAFLQSEERMMGDLVIVVDSDEVTKVTMTLSNPLTGLSEFVIRNQQGG